MILENLFPAIIKNNLAWFTLILAFALSLAFVPLVRTLARRVGNLAQPRSDRWHDQPTPILGGVAIYTAFLLALIVLGDWDKMPWGLLIGSSFAFALGLIDDLKNLSPQTKLLGLFLAASIIIFSGNITAFFPWKPANIAISFLWIVGIANALNLLDNMDGLAGGTALIMSAFLAYFFWRSSNLPYLIISVALGGATAGFFVYNFPPASIFMGDSGSLFLGLTLASLAITREDQASNLFAVIGVPALVFLLPILDTAMVSLTRLLRGQSPAQGGRDHTSHRLVSLGLSERQTLLILIGVSLLSGLSALLLELFAYNLSLLLIPVVILVFTLFSAYLGQLKVVDAQLSDRKQRNLLTNWMVELTYRRRVLEVLLDFFLIAFAYYLSYIARSGMPLSYALVIRYLETLPIAVASTFAAFFVFGVYKGVWKYTSLSDAARLIVAVIVGSFLSGILVWYTAPSDGYSGWTFFIYGLLLIFVTVASRFSFRFLEETVRPIHQEKEQPVFIYGAGDAGEFALRECKQNQDLGYHPIGFLDDDPLKKGRSIHGLAVLGGINEMPDLLANHPVEGVIIASSKIESSEIDEQIIEFCKQNNIWLRRLRFEFEEYQ
jgi:UDP-GlcNAc:undecaprenyl-phosphate/decaprenyl-phosphate GlcNAc-1-phosphate transferase